MEVEGIARQHKHAARRICLQAICVEPGAEADGEDAGHNGVDAVLGVLVRHELHAGGHLDADNVGTWLRGLTARRTEDGNAGKGFQTMSSGRIDWKRASPGWWVRVMAISDSFRQGGHCEGH